MRSTHPTYTGMAHVTFRDSSGITLQLLAIDIVIRLTGRELCVSRSMARGAVDVAVSGAVAEQALACERLVRIGSKGQIAGDAPVVRSVESGVESLVVGVAHLASRQVEPARASGGAQRAEIAMTVIAGDPRHRSALAFGLRSGMAHVTGV